MKKEDIAYCGLNCELCKRQFVEIRRKIKALEDAFEKINIKAIVKEIPSMEQNYKGYKELMNFFSYECPGCRNNGGDQTCEIRKCAVQKGYYTCAECEQLCRKLEPLLKIHTDNEITDNLTRIKEKGIESLVNKQV